MSFESVWKKTLLLLVLWVSSACAAATPVGTTAAPVSSQASQNEIIILAFGDSLTEGFGVDSQESYPAQLQRKLQADGHAVQVINGGISGETSTSALARLDWMLNTQPDIVIVETGANDALRGVDLELTRKNIDEITRRFTASEAVVVIAGLQIIQNLGQDYTTDFAEIYPAVAEKHGSILIPFVLEGVAANPELNQPDFIHPTAEGYAVMVEHIYPFILEAIRTAENKD
jgi:acyl-CoA thioesterase-1